MLQHRVAVREGGAHQIGQAAELGFGDGPGDFAVRDVVGRVDEEEAGDVEGIGGGFEGDEVSHGEGEVAAEGPAWE